MEILGTKKKRCKANNDVQDHQWESSYSEGRTSNTTQTTVEKHARQRLPDTISGQRLERPPSWGSNSAVSRGFHSLTDKAELNSYILGGGGSVCAPKSWHYNQLDDCGYYHAEKAWLSNIVVAMVGECHTSCMLKTALVISNKNMCIVANLCAYFSSGSQKL